MLMKEYRICMPLTVEEYQIGQLYMISKHCSEQSGGGDGVEVVKNEPEVHPQYGQGQLTEKRIYLNGKLPGWAKAFVPRFFYVTEKAWNFYPYTITEYSVSFLPKFSIRIETRFENNKGDNHNVFGDKPTPSENVIFLDILSDPIPDRHYKEAEDLSQWQSSKTGRGPLEKGWTDEHQPIMCSYKRVHCSFEVYGFQTKTEEFIHRNIKDILLLGHRQAVAWIDEWHGLTLEQVREYEHIMQEKTNCKVKCSIVLCISLPLFCLSLNHNPPLPFSLPVLHSLTPSLSGYLPCSISFCPYFLLPYFLTLFISHTLFLLPSLISHFLTHTPSSLSLRLFLYPLSLVPSSPFSPPLPPTTPPLPPLSSLPGPPQASRPMFSRSISVTDELSLKKMGVPTAVMPDPALSKPHGHARLNSTPE